jgi:pyruvate ferredoxin oxidoreductase delta subunit
VSNWDVSEFDDWKAEDFPLGGVALEGGNSKQYITGGWRSFRPIWNAENCRDCMLCWMHCPDSSIQVDDGKMTGIDLDHCKGCGVCVTCCKFDALKMIPESDAKAGE